MLVEKLAIQALDWELVLDHGHAVGHNTCRPGKSYPSCLSWDPLSVVCVSGLPGPTLVTMPGLQPTAPQ